MFLELSKKVCLLMTGASRFLLSGEEVAIRVNVVYSLIREMLPVFKHRNQGICHSSVDFFRGAHKACISVLLDAVCSFSLFPSEN